MWDNYCEAVHLCPYIMSLDVEVRSDLVDFVNTTVPTIIDNAHSALQWSWCLFILKSSMFRTPADDAEQAAKVLGGSWRNEWPSNGSGDKPGQGFLDPLAARGQLRLLGFER